MTLFVYLSCLLQELSRVTSRTQKQMCGQFPSFVESEYVEAWIFLAKRWDFPVIREFSTTMNDKRLHMLKYPSNVKVMANNSKFRHSQLCCVCVITLINTQRFNCFRQPIKISQNFPVCVMRKKKWKVNDQYDKDMLQRIFESRFIFNNLYLPINKLWVLTRWESFVGQKKAWALIAILSTAIKIDDAHHSFTIRYWACQNTFRADKMCFLAFAAIGRPI